MRSCQYGVLSWQLQCVTSSCEHLDLTQAVWLVKTQHRVMTTGVGAECAPAKCV